MYEDEPPPDAAEPLTASDLGATRAALDQIRVAGIQGAQIDAAVMQDANIEHEEEEDATPDVLDTPFLRELEIRSRARAKHARNWRPQFLAALRLAPFTAFAARAAAVDPKTVALHRLRDSVFAEACDLAEQAARSLVLASAWSSAVDGTLEPVYNAGVLVGYVRKYSDKMRAMFLQGMFPETFRPPDRLSVRLSSGSGADDTAIDAARAMEIVQTLSPVMAARHVAMIAGQKPPELPGNGGFVRLQDVKTAAAKVVETPNSDAPKG